MEFERKMTCVYPIKAKITGYGSPKSIKTLNRRLHWGKRGIVYQHNPRHVDVLVKDLGLEHGNSVQTPATPGVTEEEESEPLSQDQHHRYTSQVARCLFLSQDRADITFIVNELRQKMSSSNQQSLAKLKRLARYLKRERQWRQVFEHGKLAEELTVFTDSDLAGLQRDPKVVERRRDDAGKTHPESIHTKAEGDCEEQRRGRTVCSSIGSVRSAGVHIMMCDLGFAVKPVLTIDAKATEHILHRQGIGKLKHIDVAYLWVQNEIRSQRLRVRRVRSEENVADLGAKPLSRTVIAKHCLILENVNMDGENVQSGWQVRCSGLRFSSQLSGRQQDTTSRSQPAETLQQQKQLQDPQQQQRAPGSWSRCQRGFCSTLPWIMTHCSNRLRKVQPGRTHTSSSAETSSESAPNVSVARKSRQIFTEHHEVLR